MDKLREEIDEIDENLMNLLFQRFTVIQQIGKYKKQNNIPIHDDARENEIYDKIKDKFLLDNVRNFIISVYGTMLTESKMAQH
jgi:chorismate mutase